MLSFPRYHVRACVVAGVGFFTDSYDIFAVGLLTTMLGIVYWPKKGSMPTNSDTAIKVATSGGTIVGQLGFGALADIVGRKRMYGLELIVIIFATLAQSLTSNSPSVNLVVSLGTCIARCNALLSTGPHQNFGNRDLTLLLGCRHLLESDHGYW